MFRVRISAECYTTRAWGTIGNPVRETRGKRVWIWVARDKGNPKVSKRRIISTRTLFPPRVHECFGRGGRLSIVRGRMRVISRTADPRLRPGPSFWSYATGQLLSCRWIARGNTYCRIMWSREASAESRNYLASSEGWAPTPLPRNGVPEI